MLANAPEHGTLLRVREALAKRGFNALVGIAFLMIMVTVTMNVMMVATVVLMVVVIAMSMAMIVRCWQWLMVAMHFSRCFQSRVLCYSVVALAVRDLVFAVILDVRSLTGCQDLVFVFVFAATEVLPCLTKGLNNYQYYFGGSLF